MKRTLIFLLVQAMVFSLKITTFKDGIGFLYALEYIGSFVPENFDVAEVVKVIDGNTVLVSLGGRKEVVRLIGVKIPKRFDKFALSFTKTLLGVKRVVRITHDSNILGEHGQLFAYVWFPVRLNGNEVWVLYNLAFVLNGFGRACTEFPFRKDYMKTFAEAEKFARENLLGLWGHFDEIVLVNAIESGKFSPKIKIMRIEHSGKDEYVVLRNITDAPIDLTGWKLFSEGEQWYTFPDVILQPGEEIEIHSGPRAEGALTWTKRYVWNNRGDKAILYDSSGNVVDTYSY